MRVIGLISGTSADGVDAALTDISGSGYDIQVKTIAGHTTPYAPALRQDILTLGGGAPIALDALAQLDDAIAQSFANAAQALIHTHGQVDLIASHGQTVFHRALTPAAAPAHQLLGYSLQLGRGEVIAALTQCPTIDNFRRADIAAGGEGAPLVPPVDVALLSHPHHWRCVQNIGGIGNVALLPPQQAHPTATAPAPLGWDTGPGNSLIDLAVIALSEGQAAYDMDGAWAAAGTPDTTLIDRWLQHPYFHQPPPKSTGRELFGKAFLATCMTDMSDRQLLPADCLATLTEFTAASIADSYQRFLPQMPDEILLCGGGSRNRFLVQQLQQRLPHIPIATTTAEGVPVDLKEAIAFAVLGYWRHHEFPGNLPSVTGASRPVLLGDYHLPPTVV